MLAHRLLLVGPSHQQRGLKPRSAEICCFRARALRGLGINPLGKAPLEAPQPRQGHAAEHPGQPRIMSSLQHRHQHSRNVREGDFAGSQRVLGILLPPTQLALSARPRSHGERRARAL